MLSFLCTTLEYGELLSAARPSLVFMTDPSMTSIHLVEMIHLLKIIASNTYK
jgi:hypothetical protein